MQIQKWNFKTREYEPYEVPDEWHIKTFSMDMDEIVNCPHCGREFTFGDCYTSRQMHIGLGGAFAVCAECYRKEWEEEESAKKETKQ